MKDIKLSIPDQSQVRRNGTARQALQESGELIQWAEQLGTPIIGFPNIITSR